VYEEQPVFENYTKHLSAMRTKWSLSKYSHIMPHNQRVISRFIEEREKVAFVLENKELI